MTKLTEEQQDNLTEIQDALEDGMTVGDLIESLRRYPKDHKVVFESDYGDRGHTMQALPVQEVLSLVDDGGSLRTSHYSKSGIAIHEDHPDDERTDTVPADLTPVIILRS